MKLEECKCKFCKNCKARNDKRNWTRYSCKYAPNIEFLGGFPSEELNPTCGKFERKEEEE